MRWLPLVMSGLLVVLSMCATSAAQDFVNWESPHVHPLDVTPDGELLLAVNTADNRLEVMLVEKRGLKCVDSIPVGLDPVSVRALNNTTAWVVNHISDSISIVDLPSGIVTDTILTGDEPADVVFAGAPLRAFVSISQLNEIHVYDPADLTAPPEVISVDGEDPRALATDGSTVWACIFESGNHTTLVPNAVVSSNLSPYAGSPNPPPNAGEFFDPPFAPDLPAAPTAGLIVRRAPSGEWLDVNGADWSAAITWDLHDHDVAIIDAETSSVSYETGLMTMVMALTIVDGDVVIVGTEALNEIRFEPNINGVFSQVVGARVGDGSPVVTDLNPHLDYQSSTVAQRTRDLSIGDPRGVAWDAGRSHIAVTGMGSNNVVVYDDGFNVIDRVEVGEGPTGIVYHAGEDRYYVLNRFDGSISEVDANPWTEYARVPFFDPTPVAIRVGRPHLFDTHRTSGLGHVSCATCHVDTRMDQIAWDLGDPTGAVKPFDQGCFGGACEDWHPVKGPLMTQSLQGLNTSGALHWRGDRGGLGQFNVAFESLLGDDVQLTDDEMDEFRDYIQTIVYPPNPFRLIDNALATTLPNGGDAANGEELFLTGSLDGFNCDVCHTPPSGTNDGVVSGFLLDTSVQSLKNPQLRNLYEKTGFDRQSQTNRRGFGFVHDGSIESLFNFLESPRFDFSPGAPGDQERRDVEAYLLSFSQDTPAGIGAQATVGGSLDQVARRNTLVSVAAFGDARLVVKGTYGNERRGFVAIGGGLFQSDRVNEIVSQNDLDTDPGVLTYTLVPVSSETRIGLDRDRDGFFDQDELDLCTDPSDPDHFPGSGHPPIVTCDCRNDLDHDGAVGVLDLLLILADWGPCPVPCLADIDGDGTVGILDLLEVLGAWGDCPDAN